MPKKETAKKTSKEMQKEIQKKVSKQKTKAVTKSECEKTIVLLDSHAILHRAYHALPDFASSKGEPTGALFGLSTMLFSIINELKPDYVVATFDLPKPTYRHMAYEDYKAGRKETDNDLKKQFNRARDLFKAFNIPIYEKEGFEADDILGTIADMLKGEKNVKIIIASGDMDTLQLVDKNKVQVYTLKKGIKDTILYNEKQVKERYGFNPINLIDYKGLRGDPSDNIIGVKGIGDKTATALILKYGNLENIYKKIKKVEKENKDYFEELKKESPDLKALKNNPLQGKAFEEFKEDGFKERTLMLLMENQEEAEFSKMLATIRKDAPIKFSIPNKPWRESVNKKRVKELFYELEFRSLVTRFENMFEKEGTANGVSGYIENSLIEKAPDETQKSINENGIDFKKTALALWILNSNITNPKMDDIYNFTNTNEPSEFEGAKQQILEKIKEEKLDFIYEKIELPLIDVILRMEKNGVRLDVLRLKKLSQDYHKKLEQIQKEIYKMAGKEFNINSPKQLSEILFYDLKLTYKGLRKSISGKYSTKEEVLQKLKNEGYEIAEKILEYREYQKLLSTYIDNLPLKIEKDGRLRATFSQTGTTTGRLSSNDPNLQNIPVGTENGREIRKSFVSEEDAVLVAFDYSQIELRIAAFLSGDKKLISAFKNNLDIHTAVAAEVFDIKPEDVKKEERRKAKVINFGILYGMGVSALQKNLETDRKTAQEFLNKYFESYSGLASYTENIKKETAKKKYTETLFGRRRYFDGFNSPLPFIRAQAERMAVNAPIQGTQADLIKLAMVRIDDYLKESNLTGKIKLILQIHDEVIFEVKKNLLDKNEPKKSKIIADISEIMENILDESQTKGVPIIVKAVIGQNWGEME